MSAFCFFDVYEVSNPEDMDKYRSGVFATVQQYGGKYRIAGGDCEQIEGEWAPTFAVLLEFPSLADAHDWYDSAEYADLKALRLGASASHAVFMETKSHPFIEE